MDLSIVWFILIAVLYIGFFVLEGFDFGVGILLPFLGKNDVQRRAIINTVGPHWDGNEVWLLTAGGATFAAFPHWYATLFSGFYLPFFLLLAALIVRGVAFEFRSKDDNPTWRKAWDWGIFGGSLVATLLLGVAFSNLVKGIPIDINMQYIGGFFNLLNPYALVGGLVLILAFAIHGGIFLSLKTTGDLAVRARQLAWRLWPIAMILYVLYAVLTYTNTDILSGLGVQPGPVPVITGVALLVAGWAIRQKRAGLAFGMMILGIASSIAAAFLILYPRVLISSLDPEFSITIQEAASSPATLQIMTVVAVVFVPVVLIYQGWSYWVFRKRIETRVDKLVY